MSSMTGSNRTLAGLDERSTPFGSITDVSGIRIGHHQRIGRGWASGTTVVACAGGVTPGVDVRGGAPGTRETDAIRPGQLVDTIQAVCLTGGSAYGLAAADGVMAELASRRLGVPVGVDPAHVVPVVPSAVIFDLGRGGRFESRPDASFGRRAAQRALGGRAAPAWGAVGAGTGARAGGIQGGVGTASTVVDLAAMPTAPGAPSPTGRVEVGAVVVVNSLGSVIDPSTGLPWEPSGARLRRPSRDELAAFRAAIAPPAEPDQEPGDATATAADGPSLNTTIGVVAVSAPLDSAAVGRVASVAHDGLARAIRPAHGVADGDSIFAIATGITELPDDPLLARRTLDLILTAAADTFAAACTHAVVSARSIGPTPAWSDLCPSAIRH